MLTLTTVLAVLHVMFLSSFAFRTNRIILRKFPTKSFFTKASASRSFGNSNIRWTTTRSVAPTTTTFSKWRLQTDPTRVFTTISARGSARDDDTSIFLEGLNAAQMQAVTQPLNSVTRVIAGPGAGKTRVLTSRVAYLLEQDEKSRILAVTFTRKAAGEMRERLEKILHEQEQARGASGGAQEDAMIYDEYGIMEEEGAGTSVSQRGLSRVTVGTFHSVCGTILRWNGEYLDFLPSVVEDMIGSANETYLNGQFTIIDSKDQAKMISECLKELEIDVAKQRDVSPRNILAEISRIKAEKLQGSEGGGDSEEKKKKSLSRSSKIASEVYPLYRQRLLSKNMVDFDDLIYMTHELLSVQAQVRENLQRRWPHVLVDEFQDTSKVQLELIKFLTSSSLLIVGDADQSIYSWRGAHVKSMSDFEVEFQQVSTVYLMENYRSTSNIVKAAQKVISDSKSDSVSANAKMRQDMKPMRGEGPPPRVVAFPNGEKQAEFVVKEIKDLIEKKVLGSNPTVAIIYRTNAQSRELEEACVKMNLPYVIVGKATSFYQREEVKDCLCFLRWICNGLDETAMLRAFKTPSKGIGEKAIEEFASYYKKVVSFYTSQGKARLSPLDVLISLTDFRRDPAGALLSADAPTPNDTISKRAIKSLEKFSTQMRQIREVAYSESLDKLLSAIVEIFDFRSHVLAISNNSKEEFEERWGNVQELQVATKRYSNDIPCLPPRQQAKEDENSIPLANFLDDVALVADLEVEADAEGEEKRVVANLMTIHASKGKEFDAVFIVGNEDGTFPTMQAIEGNAEIDEERRLCYVAITRAKTYLYMTWRQEVNIYTEQGIRSRTAYRSRFLDKLVSNGVSQSAEPDQNGRDLRRSVALPSLSTNDRFKRFSSKSSRSYPKSSVPSDSSVPKYGDSRTRQSTSPTFDTTKVYGSKSHIFNDIASKASLSQRDETNRRQSPLIQRNYLQPVQPKSAKPKLSTSTSSSSQPQAFRPMSTTSARKPVESSKSKIPPATFNTKRSMSASVQQDDHLPQSPQPDSTWFYPIGSSVLHRDHGIGVVLQPPPRSFQSRNEKLWVRVEFETGEVLEFDAVGTDLLPN